MSGHELRQKYLRLLDDNLRAAKIVAQRLQAYHASLLLIYPFTAASIAALDNNPDTHQLAAMDGMIKRFEQLLNLEQDNLFKTIAMLDNDPSASRAKRDLTDYMERIGCVRSAASFSDIAMTRNRLAHEYPIDPVKQARLVNDVMIGTQLLLDVLVSVEHYVQQRVSLWQQEV
jgi:hypothetical protein